MRIFLNVSPQSARHLQKLHTKSKTNIRIAFLPLDYSQDVLRITRVNKIIA